jgi:hypothetical protein
LWLLWRKATTFHKLPSEVFGERDALAAWMLDNVVLTFGTIVENMLLERDEIGSGSSKTSVARYRITQLLDPDFLYPRPSDEEESDFSMPVQGIIFDEVS